MADYSFATLINLKKMASIFTKIIERTIPCYLIAEDAQFIAFLDVFPLRKGHVLVVPKIEEDKLFDLPLDYLQSMLLFAKPIADAIEKAMPCNRVGISAIGLEVPHAHLHLVPINSANDLNFTQSKLSLSPEEFVSIQEAIRLHLPK